MNSEELQVILDKHQKWLRCEKGGERADLTFVDLSSANLYGANLRSANLEDANLRSAKEIPFIPLICPEKGSFTAFKKAYTNNYEGVVVELEIPSNAKRSSGTSRKCRASEAKVINIYQHSDNEWKINNDLSPYGFHDESFIYRVGKTAIPDSFDDDRWNECSNGIHFFMSFEEAVRW